MIILRWMFGTHLGRLVTCVLVLLSSWFIPVEYTGIPIAIGCFIFGYSAGEFVVHMTQVRKEDK